MIRSFNVPVPAAPGTGPVVDVSAIGGPRTVVSIPPAAPGSQCTLEISGDGERFASALVGLGVTGGVNVRTTDLRFPYVRCVRVKGSGFAAPIQVMGEDLAETKAREATVVLAADTAAGSATSERPFFRTVDATRVTAIRVAFAASVTGSPTNYATITIRRRTAEGALTSVVGAWKSDSVAAGLTPFEQGSFVLGLDASVNLAPGEELTYELTKTGAGVQLPVHFVSAAL